MYKLFLFFIINIYAFAQTIHFKEQRYIYALNNSIYKKGFIDFSKKSIETWYEKSDEKLIFKDSNLYIKKGSTLTQNNNIASKVYFTLLEGIFFDNKDKINSFFKIEQKEEKTLLLPKNSVSNYLEKVEYKKQDNKLEFLKIFLLNNDRIIIEQID